MATTIGQTSIGGFNATPSGALHVLASKFTSPATFTPGEFFVYFSEEWGVGGTVYVAIYSDNAGSPNEMIWSSSASYSSGFTGWAEISMSLPPELANATDYWLAAYWVNSSGSFIVRGRGVSTGSLKIQTWEESTAGSWTNTPSTSNHSENNRELSIYASELVVDTLKINIAGYTGVRVF